MIKKLTIEDEYDDIKWQNRWGERRLAQKINEVIEVINKLEDQA